jgi:hypothetical protein
MILVHVRDIVKEAPTDAPWPDVTAIPREFRGNYEIATLAWHSAGQASRSHP